MTGVLGWNFFYTQVMNYTNLPLDIPDLIAILEGKGLEIADEKEAEFRNRERQLFPVRRLPTADGTDKRMCRV